MSTLQPSNVVNLRKQFFAMRSRSDIANLLGISELHLILCLYKNKNNSYKTFFIKKKTGGLRVISAPNPALKKIQRKLNQVLQEVFQPYRSTSVQGFTFNRSVITNAKAHLDQRV